VAVVASPLLLPQLPPSHRPARRAVPEVARVSTGAVERMELHANFGGQLGMIFASEVHSGLLVVKRGKIVSEYLPRAKVHTGPGLGPHYTDDPEALRRMASVLEAAAALLEKRQQSHHDAKVAEGLWC
jgi:hypothetical protein